MLSENNNNNENNKYNNNNNKKEEKENQWHSKILHACQKVHLKSSKQSNQHLKIPIFHIQPSQKVLICGKNPKEIEKRGLFRERENYLIIK